MPTVVTVRYAATRFAACFEIFAAEQLTRNAVDKRYGRLPPVGPSVGTKDQAAFDYSHLPAIVTDAELMSMRCAVVTGSSHGSALARK